MRALELLNLFVIFVIVSSSNKKYPSENQKSLMPGSGLAYTVIIAGRTLFVKLYGNPRSIWLACPVLQLFR